MTGTYKVVLTRHAGDDLATIHEYISADSPGNADRFIKEVEEKILSLANMPCRAPLIPENILFGTSYRHLVHGKYRIIFRVQDATVIVLRVIHGARQLKL